MTEDDARDWVRRSYGAEALNRLGRYVDLLLAANEGQNLISRPTVAQVWVRHIADSAQLAQHLSGTGSVADIGSGPGLPGLVLAILLDSTVTLIEPRKLRCMFLAAAAEALELKNAIVFCGTVRNAKPKAFKAITARAYSSLPQTFSDASHLASGETRWILPKGKSAWNELAVAKGSWHGAFHVEQSITDPHAGIVIAENVQPRRL